MGRMIRGSTHTPETRRKMAEARRAAWERQKANAPFEAMRNAAPALYTALRGMVAWFDCQREQAPVEQARKALAKADGR